MITSSKIGKFVLRTPLINSNPKLAQRILSKCIVVRAEMKWEWDGIEYVAISDQFKPVPQGAITPRYEIEFRELGNGYTKARFLPTEYI